jgi:hypothetical protein
MSDITIGVIHREPEHIWAVVSRPMQDEWDTPEHLVVKGNGFHFSIVACLESLEEATDLAIAMNYWETRPL